MQTMYLIALRFTTIWIHRKSYILATDPLQITSDQLPIDVFFFFLFALYIFRYILFIYIVLIENYTYKILVPTLVNS